jgi:hypothetical protein
MSRDQAMASLTGTPIVAPPAVTEVPQAPIQSDSARFAHLAKKESEIVRQRDEIKRDRELVTKERAEAQAILQKEKDFENLKKINVIEALKLKGFTEQDIFNFMAENQPVEATPEQKAAKAAEDAAGAKIKAWEDEQAKKQAEELSRRDVGLISGFKGTISKTIGADKDKYEYCAHHGAVAESLVYETVLASIRESKGKDIMSAKEAIELVEQYYEDEDKSMSTLKKRNPVTKTVTTEAKPAERTRTVTNQRGETVKPDVQKTRTVNTQVRTMAETREQKRDRLVAALKNGKLA